MQILERSLRLQRNLIAGILFVMIFSNTLLIIKLYEQKIVTRLVPTISDEQLISNDFINDAALRARAEQIIYLLFSMKKENIDNISALLLRQVDNSSYDNFKKQIELLSEDIKFRNYRYIFTDSQGYEFDNYNFTVKIKGYLETYLAGKQIDSKYKEYLIEFANKGGILTLKAFREVEDAKNN